MNVLGVEVACAPGARGPGGETGGLVAGWSGPPLQKDHVLRVSDGRDQDLESRPRPRHSF